MKKNRSIPLIIFVISAVSGLLIMVYPTVASAINEGIYSGVINSYNTKIVSDSEEKIKKAEEYNKTLTNTKIVDAFTNPENINSEEYGNLLSASDDGLMGHINIPKIGVDVPIYHGTSTEVLSHGAGHFEGSSLPVGGPSTHAVISAHRGLPSARLFTDLDQMRVGDMFYIYVFDNVYAYQVDQVKVIEPSDLEDLNIEEGRDYVTLVTCTPYAINTHRLLVRGTRVEYSPLVEQSTKESRKLSSADKIFYAGFFTAILIIVSVILITRKMKKRVDNNTKEILLTNTI